MWRLSTFKGIVVVMNIDVPAADIRDVNLKASQSGGLCLPYDRWTISVLVTHEHPRVRVREHLLVVNVPLVPPIGVHQVSLTLEHFDKDNSSNDNLKMDPVQGGWDNIGCESDVEGGEGSGGRGGMVDQVDLGPWDLHRLLHHSRVGKDGARIWRSMVPGWLMRRE